MYKILLLLFVFLPSVGFTQDNPFGRVEFLLGNWSGEGNGFGNNKSKIESSFQLVLDGKYIEVINESFFEPTEKNPKGEHHVDKGFISFDKDRSRLVFRQFNNEGYINEYMLNDSISNDTLLVFETVRIENFVPGGKARWTIKRKGDSVLETVFDVSFGKNYNCFGINNLSKSTDPVTVISTTSKSKGQIEKTHNFPVDSSYSIENAYQKIKKNYPGIKKVPVIVSKKIKAEYNQVYATIENSPWGKRDLHLDVFSPAKAGKYPALIMVHGGGWRSGNKSMEHAMAVRIAESGFVTIPVEYRLSLEASYPNAIYDIKSAIRWVKQHADRYGIDTTRIAIEGNSAGGQLATLVGMTNGVELFEGEIGLTQGKASINAIVDIDGVVNFIAPGSLKIETSPGSVGAFWLGGTFEEKPSSWKEASPAYWVGKNSVPLLIIQGTEKRFTAGMYDMRAQMDQFGIYSEYQIIENSPHTFWLFDPWFEPTINHTIRFLKKVFD